MRRSAKKSQNQPNKKVSQLSTNNKNFVPAGITFSDKDQNRDKYTDEFTDEDVRLGRGMDRKEAQRQSIKYFIICISGYMLLFSIFMCIYIYFS
jgi:hypothetical protein